jgi:hypothetical protein
MRIRRFITISAILALGAAGAALSASEIAAATSHASITHVQVTDSSVSPTIMYRG